MERRIRTIGEFRGAIIEGRALAADSGVAGGYLLSGSLYNEVIKAERALSVMRQICKVLTPLGEGLEEIHAPAIETEMLDGEWTSELGVGTDDSTATFGDRLLKPHGLAKRVKVSNKVLRAPDAEQTVLDLMAAAQVAAQEKGFINGVGPGMPVGILQDSSVPVYETAVSGNFTAEELREFVFSLPARYQANARLMLSDNFLKKIMLLKDGDGQFIFNNYDGKILNFPVVLSDGMPTCVDSNDDLVAGAAVAILGDFNYYWIQDDGTSMVVQRLRELYAETNQAAFQIWQAVDGQVVASNAFYILKLAE